jgi:hypothetical protein
MIRESISSSTTKGIPQNVLLGKCIEAHESLKPLVEEKCRKQRLQHYQLEYNDFIH